MSSRPAAVDGREGHYKRRLTTRYGMVGKLRMPRPLGGRTDFTELSRCEQRRWDVDMRPSVGSDDATFGSYC
jgi:hypothetical protein